MRKQENGCIRFWLAILACIMAVGGTSWMAIPDETTTAATGKSPAVTDEPARGPGRLRQRVMGADKDGDGIVSLEELKAHRPSSPTEMMEALDQDGDGKLSRDEMMQLMQRGRRGPGRVRGLGGFPLNIGEVDKNKDGKLTYAEIRAQLPQFREEIFKRLDRNDDGFIAKDEMPRMGGFISIEMDTNKDGLVSLAEVRKANPRFPEDLFKRIDQNKDGQISQKEMPRYIRGPRIPGRRGGPGLRGRGLGREPGQRPGIRQQQQDSTELPSS